MRRLAMVAIAFTLFVGTTPTALSSNADPLDNHGPTWPPGATLDFEFGPNGSVLFTLPRAIPGESPIDLYLIYRDGTLEMSYPVLHDREILQMWVYGHVYEQTYEFAFVAIDMSGHTSQPLETGFTYQSGPTWPEGAELNISHLTGASVFLSWPSAVSDHGYIANYEIEWYVGHSSGAKTVLVDGETTSFKLTELTPDEQNTVAVRAIDNNGTRSEIRLYQTFVSYAVPYWPESAELLWETISASAVLFAWPAASYDLGEVMGYTIAVNRQDREYVDPESDWHFFVLDGFEPETEYLVEVAAFVSSGRVTDPVLSTIVSFNRPPYWPTGASPSFSNITSTSVTVTWPAATSNDYEIDSYLVVVLDETDEWTMAVGGSKTSAVVTGLHPGHRYDVLVYAFDTGNGTDFIHGEFQTMPTQIEGTSIGAFDPATGEWHLLAPDGSVRRFWFGNPGDIPFVGDWDGDGIHTPGLYRQSTGFAYLIHSIPRNGTAVSADLTFYFGSPGDVPIVGDWNKDGKDTLSIYRRSEGRVYIINRLSGQGGAPNADFSYYFGNPGDKPFAGNFNGDGIDTVGLHRESTGIVYFRNSHTQGVAHSQFYFGIPGDRLIGGDWGLVDGVDTPAVFRPSNNTWYFRFSNTQGFAEHSFVWGKSHWLPVAGNWVPAGG